MGWGTKKEDKPPVAATGPELKPGEDKPPDKSIADQIAEAVGPLKETITALQAELTESKKPKVEVKNAEITSVLDDEDAAFNQRLTPILQKQLEMEARMVYQDIKKEYESLGFSDLWKKNELDIVKELDNASLVTFDAEKKQVVPLRGNPNFIRNVADMVIGRSMRKEGVKYSGKENKFYLEDTNGETNFITRQPLETEGLTAKQIAAAKRFGIPVKDYKAAFSKLDVVQ